MTLTRVELFWKWFDEIRRFMPVREVERRAGCPRGRIGNARSQQREPTPLVIEAIADGLGEKVALVYRKAGLLPPPVPGIREDASFNDLLGYVRELTAEQREELLRYARWRFSRQQENRAGKISS